MTEYELIKKLTQALKAVTNNLKEVTDNENVYMPGKYVTLTSIDELIEEGESYV